MSKEKYTTLKADCQEDLLSRLTEIKIESKYVRSVLADFYRQRGEQKKADKILHCNDFLQVMQFADKNTTQRLLRSNSCMSRFCNICSHKKARVDGLVFMLADMLVDYQTDYRYERWHLSLGCENCPGDSLRKTIQGLTSACTKFLRYRCENYYRKLEITYNEDNNTYHPHLHILIYDDTPYDVVPYWRKLGTIKKDFGAYLAKEPRISHGYSWAMAECKQVDDDEYIREMTKYVTKDCFVIPKTVPYLVPACKGLRFVAVRGVLKPLLVIARKLIADMRQEDLIALQNQYDHQLISYAWHNGQYFQTWTQQKQAALQNMKGKTQRQQSKIVSQVKALAQKYAKESGWLD